MSIWNTLEKVAREGLNEVQERIVAFEADGGFKTLNARLQREIREQEARLAELAQRLGPNHRRQVMLWYARLEVPPGSNLQTVRQAYHRLMRRYHPDRFASDRDMEEEATRLSQELTVAYRGLRDHLEDR